MLYCPYCRIANRDGSRFCNGCGQPLATADLQCPVCGSGNLPSGRFCQQCGASLSLPAPSARVLDLSPDDPDLPDLEADSPSLDDLLDDVLTDEDRAIIAWAEAFAPVPVLQPVASDLTDEDRAVIAWAEALGPTVELPLTAAQEEATPPPVSLAPPPAQAPPRRPVPKPARPTGHAHPRPPGPVPVQPEAVAPSVMPAVALAPPSEVGVLPPVPIEVVPPIARAATSSRAVAVPDVVQPVAAVSEQPPDVQPDQPAPAPAVVVQPWLAPDWLEIAEPMAEPAEVGELELPGWLFLAEPEVIVTPVELPDWLFLAEPEVASAPPELPDQIVLAEAEAPSEPVELPDWLFLAEPAPPPVATPAETAPIPSPRIEAVPISSPAPLPAFELVPTVPVEDQAFAEEPADRSLAARVEAFLRSSEPAAESLPEWLFLPEPPDVVRETGSFPAPAPTIAVLPFTPALPVDVAEPASELSTVGVVAEEVAAAEPEPPPAYDYGGAWTFVRLLRSQIAADEAAARAAAEREAAGLPPLEGAEVAGIREAVGLPDAFTAALTEPISRPARPERTLPVIGWLTARFRPPQATARQSDAGHFPTTAAAAAAPPRRSNVLGRLFRRRNGSGR